jgi:hypothetical protein
MKTPYFYAPAHTAPGQLKTFVSLIEHAPDDSDDDILDRIFAACNRGSGEEDPQFACAPIPSLSVGDKVTIVTEHEGGYVVKAYACAPIGWRSL